MTPEQLAFELGISAKALRSWLRRTFPRPEAEKWSSWTLSAEQVAAARAWRQGRGEKSPEFAASRTPPIARAAARPDIRWDTRFERSYRSQGFRPFVPLGEAVAGRQALLRKHQGDLGSAGVYAVFAPLDWATSWKTRGRFSNVINPWPLERLRERWIEGVELVYIGCAGATRPRAPCISGSRTSSNTEAEGSPRTARTRAANGCGNAPVGSASRSRGRHPARTPSHTPSKSPSASDSCSSPDNCHSPTSACSARRRTAGRAVHSASMMHRAPSMRTGASPCAVWLLRGDASSRLAARRRAAAPARRGPHHRDTKAAFRRHKVAFCKRSRGAGRSSQRLLDRYVKLTRQVVANGSPYLVQTTAAPAP